MTHVHVCQAPTSRRNSLQERVKRVRSNVVKENFRSNTIMGGSRETKGHKSMEGGRSGYERWEVLIPVSPLF